MTPRVQPNELHNEATRSEWGPKFETTATRSAETAAVLTEAPLSLVTFVVVVSALVEQAAKVQMHLNPLASFNAETVLEQARKYEMMAIRQVATDAAVIDQLLSRDMHELVAV